jgi:small subunit ribosomal protein S25e
LGGKKKRSLRQMQKAEQKKTKKKETGTSTKEAKAISGITTPTLNEKLEKTLKKMNVITPYAIATRFDLRLSIAKRFLETLEDKGIIQFVSRSRNLTIYRPTD